MREFELTKAVRADPDWVVPLVEDFEDSLVKNLLVNNPNSSSKLEKLTLRENTSNLSILSTLSTEVPELALREISVAQKDENNRIQTARILDFLRGQQLKLLLRKVNLRVTSNWDMEELSPILCGMTGLEKLSLQFGSRPIHNGHVNIGNIVQSLDNLQDLEISSTAKVEQTMIDPDYLQVIPQTIRRLCLDHHGITDTVLTQLLENPAIANLKEFHVLKGGGVTNGVMRLIIRNLTQLEKLSVNGSLTLTESGLLGWPQDRIDFLRRSNCYSSIIHDKEPNELVGPSIKQLQRKYSLE